MAVTTKKQFPATTNATTTVFSPVSIQLNNQDDLDVYVTLSGGTRVLQLRQATGSTAQSSHPQVNNTDGLYFPAVSAGTTLYNYTLSSDNNTITFNSALPQGAVVFCERRTRDADSAYTTFASGSTIRATDLNNSSTESNFTAQDARNKALDLEGSIFGGIQPTIGGVAQPFVNSSKIIDGSIATADIADSAITSAKLADGTIVTGDIADGLVTTAKIAADAVTGAKIADDTLNSEHYAAGSIDTEHIADGNVTTAKIADSNVTTAKIADANVTTAKIANDAINGTKIADDSIDSEHYVDGSIDTAHIGNSQVTTAKIADANITAAKIASNAVTTDKIADGELTTLAGMQSGTASVLADSIALTASTAELNQLDGITLETSVTTNSDTRIPTSKAVNDLVLSVTNALGGFVAIANETSFPTTNPDPSNNAGTVVSISQLSNGLAVNSSGVATISNGAGTGNTVTITGFPSNLQSQTLPASSGLQVQTTSTLHTYTFHKQLASAADIQAISATVNSFSNRYRVSASAPTSSLDGGDLWYDTTNSKLMVYSSQNSAWEESSAIGNFFISTISSSSNTGGGSATANGTAYRFTISNAPTDAQQLLVSVDGVIQKPNAGSSQPSEGFVLVGNDIIFGSAPANGASMFVTVIGSTVGIGTPSDNTVTSAILQNGSVTTAKIVDANVTTAKLTNGAVTEDKIGSLAVVSTKLAPDAVTDAKLSDHVSNNSLRAVGTNHIKDEAVTLAKLPHGTSSNNGKFLRANNGADPSFETVSAAAGSLNAIQTTDGSGNFTASNTFTINGDTFTGHDINLNSDSGNNPPVLAVGNGHGGTVRCAITQSGAFGSILDTTGLQLGRNTQYVKLAAPSDQSGQTSYTLTFPPTAGSNGQALTTNGSGTTSWTTINSDLVADTSPQLGGDLQSNGNDIDFADNDKAIFGTGADLKIYHNGTDNYIMPSNGKLIIDNGAATLAKFISNGAVELYHANSKKFETLSNGASVTGDFLGIGTASKSGYADRVLCINRDAGAGLELRNNASSTGQISFSDTSSAAVGGYRGYIQYSHSTNIMRFGTNSAGRVELDNNGHWRPNANNTYDLGTSSLRWRNVYTNDLNLSNEGSSNDVDGSWGDWTIQEGESDLFLKNNRSGKKYKFNLTEVS